MLSEAAALSLRASGAVEAMHLASLTQNQTDVMLSEASAAVADAESKHLVLSGREPQGPGLADTTETKENLIKSLL